MKIELTNDNQEKPQSFEIKCRTKEDYDNCYSVVELVGFGATEKEANENLIYTAKEQINNFRTLIEKLERNETINKTTTSA